MSLNRAALLSLSCARTTARKRRREILRYHLRRRYRSALTDRAPTGLLARALDRRFALSAFPPARRPS